MRRCKEMRILPVLPYVLICRELIMATLITVAMIIGFERYFAGWRCNPHPVFSKDATRWRFADWRRVCLPDHQWVRQAKPCAPAQSHD